MPTGATVAVLTTSLPEIARWGTELGLPLHVDAGRPHSAASRRCTCWNWTGRSTSSCNIVADIEADGGRLAGDYVRHRRRARTSPRRTRDDLPVRGARPVRIGNGARRAAERRVRRRADSIDLHTRRSGAPGDAPPAAIVEKAGRGRVEGLARPDQGIWRRAAGPEHYVSSKLMGWVALDRAAKLAGIGG